ncbi:NAD-dependent epimerase/dehydratase family protein [Frateuria defendens]|uniref:NAD-dependent epimerase/dehydratase family protein n=1 Tax=Frateuria defendens TaxID=2219559 RepID=UPI00066FDF6A
MAVERTALVVGAGGGVGGEMVRALSRRGWRVRALARSAKPATVPDAVDWHRGDVMQAEDVRRAAEGAQVIVHAVNPPGYRGWGQRVLPMLDSTLAAARAERARVLLPGTVYNFGPETFPLVAEDAPQRPPTRKGEIRVAMEQRLAAAADGGVRTLILRCGDFFGPHAGNSWFSLGLLKAGVPPRRVSYPAAPEHRHAWAYLPDVAETAARLLEREDELAEVECFHFGGYWLDGHELTAAIACAAGRPGLRLARFPWWQVALGAPFNETLRELRKMRYLWREPLQLDDRKLRAVLGGSPYTPLEEALRITLAGIGCLPPPQRP